MIINGFKVEKYNIHSIPEKEKYWICPLCSSLRKHNTEKCMTVHWESGSGKCHHCGEVVQLHEWSKKQTTKEYKIPTWNNSTELSDAVVKWFEARKIDQFILRLLKINSGETDMPGKDGWVKMNTIQFPYFRCGEIVNIKYRGAKKEFKMFKDGELIPYNLDNVANREIVYWVEGEPDVLAVMSCGIHNVTSTPNGFPLPRPDGMPNVNLEFLDNAIDFFKDTQKFILAFDNDEPGLNGRSEFIRRFGAHKCYTVDLRDCKDSNEFLIKYGSEELKKTLEDYKEIPLSNVSTYTDHKDQVRDFFLHGMPKGLTTGIMAALDNCFSANLSHIILVTGIPSHGKSEVVDAMCCGYALNYDYKIAFASVENKPDAMHLQKLTRKLHGITPHKQTDFNKAFETVEQFTNDHFYFIDIEIKYDLETVLKKTEELIFRKGIKVLVIDPYNKVRISGEIPSITGNKTNDYTSHYLNLLNEFGYKFNVLILLVAHPIKIGKDTAGKRIVPDFYDVKGGGEFYDMCHHGLVVYKDDILNCILIRTLKVKFLHLGTNNTDTWWQYNVNNGRYSQIEDPNKEAPKPIWDNSNWVLQYDKNRKVEVIESDELWYNKESDEEIPF
jgi:twinkle protein